MCGGIRYDKKYNVFHSVSLEEIAVGAEGSCILHPRGAAPSVELVDQQLLAGPSFYYLRMTQDDGEIAWSSPV